jgi:glycosyltransferase involved in cell wall biosynthesis
VHSSDGAVATSRAVADAIGAPATLIYPGACAVDGPRAAPPGPPIIGVAGRLASIKGVRYAISALALIRAKHPLVRLEIAGTGPDRAFLQRWAASLGLSSEVSFLGWQPDLSALYLRWSALVQPSLYEGFGLSALEAMAAGLPVVGSRAGGLAEVVHDGVSGILVPARDARSLADAIGSLLDDPERSRRMGEAGRRRVRERFSMERMIDETATLYESLARTPAARVSRGGVFGP